MNSLIHPRHAVGMALIPFLLLAHASAPALGQQAEGAADVINVKAVFIFQTANFLDWSPDAFQSPKSPIIIMAPEGSPVRAALVKAVEGKSAGGRPFEIHSYVWAEDIRPSAHIIYVDHTTGKSFDGILAAAGAKAPNAFLVADGEDTAHKGAMMSFYVEESRIKLAINIKTARDAGISISSKLLRVAKIVAEGL